MSITAEQLDLPSIVLGGRSIDTRFQAFHRDHPEVYAELVKLARQAKAAGRERLGMKLLLEVIRWNRITSGKDAEGFKINNVFGSRYSRLIEDQEPDLRGLFETRELRAS